MNVSKLQCLNINVCTVSVKTLSLVICYIHLFRCYAQHFAFPVNHMMTWTSNTSLIREEYYMKSFQFFTGDSQYSDKQPHTLTFTPTGNIEETLTNIGCTSLDCGQNRQQGAFADIGRTCALKDPDWDHTKKLLSLR